MTVRFFNGLSRHLCSLLVLLALAGCATTQPEVAPEPVKPTVLITGANRGIGFELARQYAEQGWGVIATARAPASRTSGRRTEARGGSLPRRCEAEGCTGRRTSWWASGGDSIAIGHAMLAHAAEIVVTGI